MTDAERCSWVQDSDGTYNSSCGGAFVFNDDGCEENGFKFCCYCGKPVSEVKYVEEDSEETNEEDSSLWKHYCTAMGIKLAVDSADPCKWCGLKESETIPL